MNNKPDPRARLVAETFHEDWTGGPAALFARRAAAHARTRRAVRRALVAGGAVAGLAFVFFFSTRRTPFVPPPAPVVSAAPLAPKAPAYEIISDAELATLLGERPLLILPLQGGAKKFVLLDR